MNYTEREAILAGRAESAIKNWKFECLASLAPSPQLRDAHLHMLKHQIMRQCSFSEYETTKILRQCLEACRISLACAKDCGDEKDELGEDFFHVKMLKLAIATAKEVGIE